MGVPLYFGLMSYLKYKNMVGCINKEVNINEKQENKIINIFND